MKEDDVLLLRRILKADKEAFCILYESFFHALLSVACKYVENEVAKDIVQDTFFKLWQEPQKFEYVSDLRFFLYRSVQNSCLSYLRNKKAENNYRERTELFTEDFFYHVLLEEEIFVRLQKAIHELPEKYREVINLSLEGLSDREIAESLGISLDAVKQQKKRGKDRLRANLGNLYLLFLINFL